MSTNHGRVHNLVTSTYFSQSQSCFCEISLTRISNKNNMVAAYVNRKWYFRFTFNIMKWVKLMNKCQIVYDAPVAEWF